MAKIIWKGLAKKDDPIYTGGFVISSPKIRRDINKPKTNKEDKNRKSNKTHNTKKRKYTSAS